MVPPVPLVPVQKGRLEIVQIIDISSRMQCTTFNFPERSLNDFSYFVKRQRISLNDCKVFLLCQFWDLFCLPKV